MILSDQFHYDYNLFYVDKDCFQIFFKSNQTNNMSAIIEVIQLVGQMLKLFRNEFSNSNNNNNNSNQN